MANTARSPDVSSDRRACKNEGVSLDWVNRRPAGADPPTIDNTLDANQHMMLDGELQGKFGG